MERGREPAPSAIRTKLGTCVLNYYRERVTFGSAIKRRSTCYDNWQTRQVSVLREEGKVHRSWGEWLEEERNIGGH